MAKQEKQSRRAFLWTAGGLAAGGIGYLALKEKDDPNKPLKDRYPDAASRQRVLSELTHDPRVAPVYAHVEATTYAPRLEALCVYLQNKIPTLPQELRPGVQKKLNHYRALGITLENVAAGADPAKTNDSLAITDPTGTGMSRVFLTERVFESPYVRTLEDVKSILYHEGLHAVINRNGPTFGPGAFEKLVRKTGFRSVPLEVMTNPDFLRALIEVQVYNKQVYENERGTFKVSPEFRKMIAIAYYPHYQTLKQHAQQDNVFGWYAKAMLETIVVHPKVNSK